MEPTIMANDIVETNEASLKIYEKSSGYVYLLHAEGTSYIKIGHTKDVMSRIASLQPGCPFPLRVLFQRLYNDPLSVERVFHEHFAMYRTQGEWFVLPENISVVLQLLTFVHGYVPSDAIENSDMLMMDITNNGVYNGSSILGATSLRALGLLQKHGELSSSTMADMFEATTRTEKARINMTLQRLVHAGLAERTSRGNYKANPEVNVE